MTSQSQAPQGQPIMNHQALQLQQQFQQQQLKQQQQQQQQQKQQVHITRFIFYHGMFFCVFFKST